MLAKGSLGGKLRTQHVLVIQCLDDVTRYIDVDRLVGRLAVDISVQVN
jgi:hypothetical protein